MAIKSDYISGTLTITQGSTAFTGTGTGWRSAEFKEGDTLIDITGATEYMGVIEAITGEATGTLTKPWEGPSLVNVPYRMRYQPDGARSTAQARNLIEILGNGNITAFALLNGAANLLPMFTGPGAMTLITRQALVSGAAYDVQVATLADRAAYDGQDQGYAVLVSDVGNGRAAIYSKNSATSGDWSDPAYVTGEVGPVVQIEAGATTTLPTGQDATVVVRPITDGYALDFGIPRGLKGDAGADGDTGATGPRGEGLQIGATGNLAGRDAYDNEAEGFSYVDVEEGNLYFRMGPAGGWSDPIPFGKGDKGDPGDSGATIVTTNGVGNGTVGPYTLNEAPTSVSATWASISGVTQYDFTLSGNQITFAIPVEAGIAWQVKSSGVLSVVVPVDGSVGASKINASEATGIRAAINSAAKPATATAGNLAAFDANREVQDVGISKSTTLQAQTGTNDTNYMTPLKTAQAILALSPPTDTSQIALEIADLKGGRFVFKGGIADAFDDESGIFFSSSGGNDSNTKLLIHADTNFADSSSESITTNVIGSGLTISTAQSKFGGASANFTGSGRFTAIDSPVLEFGTGNFTIDFWFRVGNLTAVQDLIDKRTNESLLDGMVIRIAPEGIMRIYSSVNASSWDIANFGNEFTVAINTWYHFALTKSGNTWSLYKNGVLVSTTTGTGGLYNGSALWSFGGGNDNLRYFTGFMDEIRFSNIVRWNSSFTPPTQSYFISTEAATSNQVYDSVNDLYRPSFIAGVDQTATHTSSTQSGNIATASSTATPTYGANYNAYNAFDKVIGVSDDRSWTTNAVSSGWLQYQFSSAKVISSYSVRSTNGTPTRAPKDWTLQGSNTGAFTGEQVILDTQSNQINWASTGELRSYQINNPESFIYYRINVTANNVNSFLQIDEVAFLSSNVYSNMSLVSVSYPATSQPTKARLVIQLDTNLTVVPNVDFTGEVSRDNGVTWLLTNLTLSSTLGSIKTYESSEINISSLPAGSSMKWRARTLTNKNIAMSGVVEQWS